MKLIVGFLIGVLLAVGICFAVVRYVAQASAYPRAITQSDVDEMQAQWDKEALPDLLVEKKRR